VSRLTRHNTLAFALACACAVPTTALAQTGGESEPANPAETGGTQFVPPPPPPKRAKIDANGYAIAPAGAPRAIVRMIEAANLIVGKPYRYGGGHKPYARSSSRGSGRSKVVLDSGYDCSGSVSFALYGARLLRSPLDSRSFAKWGLGGPGRWVTVYTNPGHAYIVIAGLRFDTSLRDDPSRTGPAWSKRLRVHDSFQARHPRNL
jgi:cell wall-associated NlpC family hydrolase